ncbi:MAG: T9SS type A sorting domain-containing protein [bacterium]
MDFTSTWYNLSIRIQRKVKCKERGFYIRIFIILIFASLAGISIVKSENIAEQYINNDQLYVGLVLSNGDKTMIVDVPEGSIGTDATLKVSFAPLTDNLTQSITELQNSLNNLPSNLKYFTNYLYEVAVFTGSDPRTNDFLISLRIKLNFDDSDNDGYIDTSNPLIFNNKLEAYFLSDNGSWQLIEDQSTNTSDNSITLFINGPVTLALLGEANYSDSVDTVVIYPNPFKGNNSGKFSSSVMRFNKIPTDAVIKIYNLAGELIKELRETDTDGLLEWDVKNKSGKDVASGVYLALIEGSNKDKIYKFAVER